MVSQLNSKLHKDMRKWGMEARTIINNKQKLGLGVLKKNLNFEDVKWTDKLANELHKPVCRTFPKRRVYVNGVDKIWAADLVDMATFSKFNKGVKYLYK